MFQAPRIVAQREFDKQPGCSCPECRQVFSEVTFYDIINRYLIGLEDGRWWETDELWEGVDLDMEITDDESQNAHAEETADHHTEFAMLHSLESRKSEQTSKYKELKTQILPRPGIGSWEKSAARTL